jgi:DNA polymerase-3 subunit beta
VGQPTDNFPAIPDFKTPLAEIPAKDLLSLINRTIFSVAQEESRFALNGSLLLLKPLSITMVATDGHRLAHVEKPANFDHLSNEISVLVPKKALAELQRLLSEVGEEDTVSFGKDETHLYFQLGKRLMISRMMTGQFPNYEAVLPKDNRPSIIVDREEFAAAIKRVSLLADDTSRSIRIVLENNKLEISSRNADLGEAKDEIATDYSAGKIQVGFNCQYLLDFLAATGDPSISFDLKDDESSGQLRPATEEDYRYRYIVMPMRI